MAEYDQEQPKEQLPKELEQLEEDVIKHLEERVELKKREEEAQAELVVSGQEGSMEYLFLLIGAGVMIVILPFLRAFLAVFLTLFALIVSLVAGLASPKRPQNALLNLAVSSIGVLFFEYSAIFEYHTNHLSFLFWLYQLLALDFLLASYFSMGTYRKKVLERE